MVNKKHIIEYYYSGVLALMAICILGGLGFCWREGYFDSDRAASLQDVSSQLDGLRRDGGPSKIIDLVNRDNGRAAMANLDVLERQVTNIQKINPTPNFSALAEKFVTIRSSMEGLISSPEAKEILKVLAGKISLFEEFALSNNWTTLARTANRLKERILKQSSYNYQSLKILHASVLSDITRMEKVARNSVLKQSEKERVLGRLETLKTEMSLLEKYFESCRGVVSAVEAASASWSVWQRGLAPKILLEKMKIRRGTTLLTAGCLILAMMAIAAIIAGLVLGKKLSIRAQRIMEADILDLIEKGFVHENASVTGERYSLSFMGSFLKSRSFVRKQMGRGVAIGNALPFPAFLMNSSGKIMWANTFLYETLGLENTNFSEETLTWDFFRGFTDLADDKPLTDAFAGTDGADYAIGVSASEERIRAPYEMKIRPARVFDTVQALVVLYPVSDSEECIARQARHFLTPIERSLDALVENKFTESFKASIYGDFETVGLGDLFEKISTWHREQERKNTSLVSEVRHLGGSLENATEKLASLSGLNYASVKNHENLTHNVKTLKASLSGFINVSGELDVVTGRTHEVVMKMSELCGVLLSRCEDYVVRHQDCENELASLEHDREKVKTMREQLRQIKLELTHTIEQSIVMAKNVPSQHGRIAETLFSARNFLKELDVLLKRMEESWREEDVRISKIGMIAASAIVPEKAEDLRNVTTDLRGVEEGILTSRGEMLKCFERLEVHGERAVGSLEGLHLALNEDRKSDGRMEELLNDLPDEDEAGLYKAI